MSAMTRRGRLRVTDNRRDQSRFRVRSITLWIEHKLRHAELTSEGTLYQVRPEPFRSGGPTSGPPLSRQTSLTRLGCEHGFHVTVMASAAISRGAAPETASAPG